MALLILGLLLWSGMHLFKALAPQARTRIVERIGFAPYRVLFALLLVAALVLIILGWRATPPVSLWLPPVGLRHVTHLLMPIAVIGFLSSRLPTDIKQVIRHPQLAGVKLWAFAHLLANGEQRSVILFGGLLAWAVAEMIVINRRDGAWQKPPRVGWGRTLASAAFGLIVTALLIWAHPWFAGMPAIAVG